MLFAPRQPDHSPQLDRIEHKLDAILAHLGLNVPTQGFDEVLTLARTGKKIEAIKVYREKTGVGLAEAKAAVDAMM